MIKGLKAVTIVILAIATLTLAGEYEILKVEPPDNPDDPPEDPRREEAVNIGDCADGADWEVVEDPPLTFTCAQSTLLEPEDVGLVCICSGDSKTWLYRCENGKKSDTRKKWKDNPVDYIFGGVCPADEFGIAEYSSSRRTIIGSWRVEHLKNATVVAGKTIVVDLSNPDFYDPFVNKLIEQSNMRE